MKNIEKPILTLHTSDGKQFTANGITYSRADFASLRKTHRLYITTYTDWIFGRRAVSGRLDGQPIYGCDGRTITGYDSGEPDRI